MTSDCNHLAGRLYITGGGVLGLPPRDDIKQPTSSGGVYLDLGVPHDEGDVENKKIELVKRLHLDGGK